MKKLNYLIMPLLVVPFLATYGCSKSDPKVNEEQFNAALTMQGVDYLQISSSSSAVSKTDAYNQNGITKFSPGVYYSQSTVTGDVDDYDEIYSTGNSEECDYHYRDSKDSPFSFKHIKSSDLDPDEDYSDYFATPQKANVLKLLYGGTYNDFTFEDNAYYYHTESGTISNESQICDIYLHFNNKKLVEYTLKAKNKSGSYNSTQTMKFSYSKSTPKDPTK